MVNFITNCKCAFRTQFILLYSIYAIYSICITIAVVVVAVYNDISHNCFEKAIGTTATTTMVT